MHGLEPMGDAVLGEDEVRWAHTPFEQPWWLNAVAPGSWGEAVVERQGEVVARLPYARKTKLGLTVLTQPPLTRFVGPWLRPSTGKYATQLGVESELMTELIEKLPPHDVYRGSFAPSVTNWLPFYWAGFDATLRYTYRLDDLSDPDRLWADVGGNVRSRVKRARKDVEIRTDVCLSDILRINRQLFERQGLAPPFDDEMAHRLDEACVKRNARQIVAAVGPDGRVHAALYLVRDATTTYLLYGGTDAEFRSSGVNTLVVWEAIRRAAEESQHFDFLGSMIESVERVNRSFGAQQRPYLFVSRSRPYARAVLATRETALKAKRRLRRGGSAGGAGASGSPGGGSA